MLFSYFKLLYCTQENNFFNIDACCSFQYARSACTVRCEQDALVVIGKYGVQASSDMHVMLHKDFYLGLKYKWKISQWHSCTISLFILPDGYSPKQQPWLSTSMLCKQPYCTWDDIVSVESITYLIV